MGKTSQRWYLGAALGQCWIVIEDLESQGQTAVVEDQWMNSPALISMWGYLLKPEVCFSSKEHCESSSSLLDVLWYFWIHMLHCLWQGFAGHSGLKVRLHDKTAFGSVRQGKDLKPKTPSLCCSANFVFWFSSLWSWRNIKILHGYPNNFPAKINLNIVKIERNHKYVTMNLQTLNLWNFLLVLNLFDSSSFEFYKHFLLHSYKQTNLRQLCSRTRNSEHFSCAPVACLRFWSFVLCKTILCKCSIILLWS
jgi:hypothetical protein